MKHRLLVAMLMERASQLDDLRTASTFLPAHERPLEAHTTPPICNTTSSSSYQEVFSCGLFRRRCGERQRHGQDQSPRQLLGLWALNLTLLQDSPSVPLGHSCPGTGSCCPVLARTAGRDWSCLQALRPNFSFSAKLIWGCFGGLWSQALPPAMPVVWLRGRGAGEAAPGS